MAKNERWGKKHKDKRNWKKYNEHLIRRGEFFINPTFLETWTQELAEMNNQKVGGAYRYPYSLIQFLAIIKSFGFNYRMLEGILRGLSKRLGPFPVISFSQIRRRILEERGTFKTDGSDLVVGVDGSGLKVSNRGEWMRQKWQVRRGWIKVVVLGDVGGNVIDVEVGDENLDERVAGRTMVRKNKDRIVKLLGDGLHDDKDTFGLCEELGIETAIKIRKNASPKGIGRRPREVREYQELGYKQWAEEKGYGHRWVATEGIFSAVKRIFGECVSSHKPENMYHEAKLKFWSYQQFRAV